MEVSKKKEKLLTFGNAHTYSPLYSSIFSGRVEMFKTIVDLQRAPNGRKLHYFDIVSLYPFILKTIR